MKAGPGLFDLVMSRTGHGSREAGQSRDGPVHLVWNKAGQGKGRCEVEVDS